MKYRIAEYSNGRFYAQREINFLGFKRWRNLTDYSWSSDQKDAMEYIQRDIKERSPYIVNIIDIV